MNLYIRWNIYAIVRISNRNAKLNYYSHKSNHEMKFIQEYETSSSGGAGTSYPSGAPCVHPGFCGVRYSPFLFYCLFSIQLHIGIF